MARSEQFHHTRHKCNIHFPSSALLNVNIVQNAVLSLTAAHVALAKRIVFWYIFMFRFDKVLATKMYACDNR